METIHQILFNTHILYSLALGLWATVIAARKDPISGHYWGAMLTYALLAGAILLIGILLLATGFQPRSGRVIVYVLYMFWLAIIMPGTFTMLRGRDDRSAAIAFALLAFFNFSTSISMIERELVGPWIELT
ncbi:MAG: hypothetical protein OXG39_10915 [Chloroflexi bacterium]|nr:hypothetical protein [Chloroflexota bacterium]